MLPLRDGPTLTVDGSVLAGVLGMLLAVTHLHLVNLEVLLLFLLVILVVAVLHQSVDQLHKDLVVYEAALFKANDVHK